MVSKVFWVVSRVLGLILGHCYEGTCEFWVGFIGCCYALTKVFWMVARMLLHGHKGILGRC